MYTAHIFLISWLIFGIITGLSFRKNQLGITNVTLYPIPLNYIIEIFSMYENSISDIPPGYFTAVPTLKTIILYNNKLTVIETHMFAGLSGLRDLKLHSNLIHTIQSESFKDNMALNTLELHYNSLPTIPESMFDPQSHPTALNYFFIYFNPLQCDESLSWLKQADGDWLILRNTHLIECAGPERLEGCRLE